MGSHRAVAAPTTKLPVVRRPRRFWRGLSWLIDSLALAIGYCVLGLATGALVLYILFRITKVI